MSMSGSFSNMETFITESDKEVESVVEIYNGLRRTWKMHTQQLAYWLSLERLVGFAWEDVQLGE